MLVLRGLDPSHRERQEGHEALLAAIMSPKRHGRQTDDAEGFQARLTVGRCRIANGE